MSCIHTFEKFRCAHL